MTWVHVTEFWGFVIGILSLSMAAASLVAIVIGIFNSRIKNRVRLIVYGFLTLLTLFVIFTCLTFQTVPNYNPEWESKKNLHTIQEGLDLYAEGHNGEYPPSVDDLITEHVFDRFPQNPFTRAAMRNMPFHSEPFEGEFTYVPVSREGKIVGYYLLLYGRKENEGMDINNDGVRDHVILVLDSENTEPLPDFPPLSGLLNNPADNPQ
jgi:hypothetical protein